MSGTTQAILFIIGLAFLGLAFVKAVLLLGAAVGVLFPLAIGAAFILPSVVHKKHRKRLRRQTKELFN